MTEPKRGRGRPRREGADDEILAVALAMLREQGYGALTVDAVAERAGVAKTTVYRRWPSKGALVAAAIEPLAVSDDPAAEAESLLQLVTPVEGDVIDVLRAIVASRRARLAERVGEEEADRLLGALLVKTLF